MKKIKKTEKEKFAEFEKEIDNFICHKKVKFIIAKLVDKLQIVTIVLQPDGINWTTYFGRESNGITFTEQEKQNGIYNKLFSYLNELLKGEGFILFKSFKTYMWRNKYNGFFKTIKEEYYAQDLQDILNKKEGYF